MTIDTTALRKASTAVYLAAEAPVAKDLSDKLRGAADEIDTLRTALAAAPHSTLCSYMVDHFHEPCSCWKADPSPSAGRSVDDALDVITSLTVAGPHGRVLGLPRIRHPRLEFRGTALTVHYDNPET
jgi:hypothetical protein